MEILDRFWWVIVLLVVGVVVVASIRSAIKRREATRIREQKNRDESVILNLYNRMNTSDYREYKTLPSFAERVKWLSMHYPEFMEAVERQHPKEDYDYVIARNLDMRFLKDITIQGRGGGHIYQEAIHSYRRATVELSLNDYQRDILDKKNAEYRKKLDEAAKQKEERERREAAELARQQKEAKKYWKSLTKEQKEAFKSAKGKKARKSALPATSSTYSTDVLYPLIMATQFSDISDSSRSINHCESSGHTSHSSHSYSDGGSHHSSHDSGSYSSYDSGGGYSDGGASF